MSWKTWKITNPFSRSSIFTKLGKVLEKILPVKKSPWNKKV